MSTHGRLFLSALLAGSIMYQVVSSAATKASYSLLMSRWEKRGNIWCVIGRILLSCLDTVSDGAAAGCNPRPKLVCYCSL